MKIKYVILIIAILLIIIIDILVNGKKRISIKTIFINLSEHKIFKLNPNKDYYKKLKKDISASGLKITPEIYSVFVVFLVIITTISIILLSYLNKFNLILNIDELQKVAEMLDMPEIANINFSLDMGNILLIDLIVMILSRYVLKLFCDIKLALEDKEIIMLQTYTLMLIKANKPVKEILESLMERTKMFKNILQKTINNYSKDPKKALKEARESTGNIGFEKIIRALEQTLNNDNKKSLEYLNNQRNFTKEMRKIQKTQNNTKKGVISTLLLIIPLFVLVFIAGYPYFRFSLKTLGNLGSF